MNEEIKSRTAIEIAKMEHEEEKILFQLAVGGMMTLMVTLIIIGIRNEVSISVISTSIIFLIYLTLGIIYILRERMKYIRIKLKNEIGELI